MKLSGWTWLIVGAIIAISSAFIYFYVPRDGKPNMAMALFFFIGAIFVIIGIIKTFFNRIDSPKSVLDSIKEEKNPSVVKMSELAGEMKNSIDRQVQEMAEIDKRPQGRPQQNIQMQGQDEHQHARHGNTYAKTHEYSGPIYTQQELQTRKQSTIHQQGAAQQRPQSNAQTLHSIRCRRCNSTNPGSANYCHSCGNRLK